MRYISSAERIGMRRGAEQGFKLGTATTLHRLLRHRFDPLPDWVEPKLQEATVSQLEQWTNHVPDAETLEAIFRE